MDVMVKVWAAVAGVVLSLGLAGCSSGGGESAATPAVSPSSSCTPLGSGCWEDYGPQVQARIDAAIADKDCAALQEEFDTADANNEVTMERVGHNNADLMSYIDAGLQQAGCYD